MPSIQSQLDAAFRKAIQQAFGLDADPILAVSQNDKFGDYQSNVAMGLAKQTKSNPRQTAEKIIGQLQLGEMATEVSIAGPGFINVRLAPAWLAKQVESADTDSRLGIPKITSPQTVVVDLSGPNVAKELHVGHLRSTIIGDAIARILEFQGHRVIRQNHLGDWGTQFGMLISHLRSQSSAGEAGIEDLDKFYKEARKRFDGEPGFADTARATVVNLQARQPEEIALWQGIVEESRRHFDPLYQRLNVKLSRADEKSESFYNPMLESVVRDLKAAGIATESDGATVVFTQGYENPLIIEKSGEGGYLYGTTDLAAARYRAGELKADRIVYVVGAPQTQHLRQVFDAANRAGWTKDASLEHAPFGSVLGEDGKMFKARSGESVKLAELIDEAEERAYQLAKAKDAERVAKAQPSDVQPLPEVQLRSIARAIGVGAIKYADLSKDRIGDYTFSWDKMLAMDGNTAPYLQYAHARIKSIFRKAGAAPTSGSIRLDSSFEIALAKHVLRLGEVVDLVARELKPHHLCLYLYELATKFSSFYENCPVIQSEEPTRTSRLMLCDVTAKTLALGLDLLGIEHPEQM